MNVESYRQLVRFEYSSAEADPQAITVRLAEESTAAALIAVLPKARTRSFRPQIGANAEFEAAQQLPADGKVAQEQVPQLPIDTP